MSQESVIFAEDKITDKKLTLDFQTDSDSVFHPNNHYNDFQMDIGNQPLHYVYFIPIT